MIFVRIEPKKKPSEKKNKMLSTNTEIVINSAISTNQVSISIHNNPSMGLQISHYNPIMMILKTFRKHGAETPIVGMVLVHIIWGLNGEEMPSVGGADLLKQHNHLFAWPPHMCVINM